MYSYQMLFYQQKEKPIDDAIILAPSYVDIIIKDYLIALKRRHDMSSEIFDYTQGCHT